MPKHYIDLYYTNANYRDGRGVYPLNVSLIVDNCQAILQVVTRCTYLRIFLFLTHGGRDKMAAISQTII